MSNSEEIITDYTPIPGFTKGKGLYCLKVPWLVRKGAAGEADRILNESSDNEADS